MIEKWDKLYQEMLAGIERCWLLPLSQEGQIESAFKTALKSWETTRKELAGHLFENKEEEINFYKCIKPKFTCYIEYFPMIYLGLSYQPERDDVRLSFWQEETKKLAKFIDKNSEFVQYYRSGSTNRDQQYFLPENYDLANYIVSKAYDSDGEFMTSHDHLVAILFAREMYHQYVLEKLKMYV